MTSVIVVDDNEDIVNSIIDLLEIYGIEVLGQGHNGLECVELFDALRPDVVLLDLMMPKYDGLYALKNIRNIDPKSTVVIVTGGGTPSMHDELDALEPNKILFKPLDVNTLIESILDVSPNSVPLKIQYSFKDDSKSYTCILTYVQYKNFKTLPVIQDCKIIKNDEMDIKDYEQEMQEALDLAAQNDLSHIQKLSQII